MKAVENKLGRIFTLTFERGDDFYKEITRYVKEKNIRSASVFLLGSVTELDMVTGYRTMERHDIDRRHFDDWRELVALGTISCPAQPPAPPANFGVTWDEPQPYIHLHMALSGGPAQNGEVLVGHLSDCLAMGMTVQIYELV